MSVREEPAGTDHRPGSGRAPRSAAPVLPRGRGVGWFGASSLVNAVGTGFFYPYQLLFFVAVTALPLTTVGLGLSVATALALPVVLLVGRYVDRWGTRAVLLTAALVRAGAFVAYLFIHDVAAFVAVVAVAAVAQRAEQVSVPVLAAGIAPEGEVGRWLALTKVTLNAGMGLGGLLAGLALVGTGGRTGFVVIGLLNAASFVLAALLYLPLPTVRAAAAPAPAPAGAPVSGTGTRTGTGGGPWRHPLFLQVASTNFLLLTVIVATEAALPVYLIGHLHTHAWVVGLLFAVNTVLSVVLQLPISARLTGRAPLRVAAVGSLLHAVLLVLLAVAGELPSAALVPLLVAGVAIYTLGEIVSTQMLAVLLVTLAPEHERGAFQAVNQVLVGLSLVVVPTLVAFFLAHGPTGLWWLLVAASAVVCLAALGLNRAALAATATASAA